MPTLAGADPFLTSAVVRAADLLQLGAIDLAITVVVLAVAELVAGNLPRTLGPLPTDAALGPDRALAEIRATVALLPVCAHRRQIFFCRVDVRFGIVRHVRDSHPIRQPYVFELELLLTDGLADVADQPRLAVTVSLAGAACSLKCDALIAPHERRK